MAKTVQLSESRELVRVVDPDPIDDYSDEDVAIPDFRGFGLVPGDSDDDCELWAVDQGAATLYVIEPDGDDFAATEEIGLDDGTRETPYVVDYDSEFRYGGSVEIPFFRCISNSLDLEQRHS